MSTAVTISWVHATVMVENEWGGRGTGFLLLRRIGDGGRVFLVTNKHVLHEDAGMRQSANHVVLHINVKDDTGTVKGQSFQFPLQANDGSKLFREHPELDVDVLAVDVTALTSLLVLAHGWVDYSLVGDSGKRAELDVSISDEVLVIGYPLGFQGFRHHNTNYPLVRSGLIASNIDELLEDETQDPNGAVRKRILRGFLVDGAVIPGSSGSPVVLKPGVGRRVKGNIVLGEALPVLLGIVAETSYYHIPTSAGNLPSSTGLALAFSVDTVLETIELFFA